MFKIKRLLQIACLLAVAAVLGFIPKEAAAVEYGVDRPGGDYSNFDLNKNDPLTCEKRCMSDPNCKAWTFVRPGHQGPKPRCWLKNVVPPAKNAPCCVSGKKQSGSTVEFGIDRPGSDYKNFDLSSNDPNKCKNRCLNEGSCKAWTFVRPGHQGPSARCWLKNGVPPAKNAPCCVSGVKN